MSNNNNEMKKELGMGAAMATVVGCVIGSGVFFKPTAIYTRNRRYARISEKGIR